jgi:hypothetical protein
MRPYTAFHTNVNYVDQLFKFAVVVRVLLAVSTLQHVSTPYLENVDQFLTDPNALARVPFPCGYDSLVVGHWSYIMTYDANAAYSTVPLVMRS